VAIVALLIANAGCESVEKVDVSQPLPEKLSAEQLVITTKASWENALADFYRDDWERMKEHAARMNELVARWKGEKAPETIAKEFAENVSGFEAAVVKFQQAVESKNVEGVTEALRQIGKRVASFEVMR
jgi:hypothetical protein